MLYQLSYAPVGQRARGRYLLNFHDARAEPTLQLPFNDARLPDAGMHEPQARFLQFSIRETTDQRRPCRMWQVRFSGSAAPP